MEPIKRVLFEQPYLQAAIEATALTITLLGLWRTRSEAKRAKRWALAAAAIVILSVGGQLAQYCVITDRENIEATLHGLAKALELADVPTLLAACDENLDANGLDKTQFGKVLAKLFKQIEIHEPKITKMLVEVHEPNYATATVSGVGRLHLRELGYERLHRGTWELEFIKLDGRWLIISIVPVEPTQNWP